MNSLFTKTVNVDDAMDDIVRQFKGVSDGLMWKVAGSPSSSFERASLATSRNLSWNADDINKLATRQSTSESINSFSDNEEGDRDANHGEQEVEATALSNEWHPDYELNSQGFVQRAIKHDEDVSNLDSEEICSLRLKSESNSGSRYPESSMALTSVPQEDPTGVPPEVFLIYYCTPLPSF